MTLEDQELAEKGVLERFAKRLGEVNAAAPGNGKVPAPARPVFRVLSIDGGGIRGVIPARVLEDVERQMGKPIAECFDLIVGTSTGGIISLGLTKPDPKNPTKPQFTAKQLGDLYAQRGKDIFDRAWHAVVTRLFASKYPDSGLRKVLGEYFGDTKVSQSLSNVMVSAYDFERAEPLFIKNRRHAADKSLATHDRDFYMRDAAVATASAPSYFPPAKITTADAKPAMEHALLDGGIGANNPGIAALIEAEKLMPANADIMLVSLGTGGVPTKYSYKDVRNWSRLSWIDVEKGIPALEMAMNFQTRAADHQLRFALGDRYIRINMQIDDPALGNDRPDSAMDNADKDNIAKLERMARTVVAANRREIGRAVTILKSGTHISQVDFENKFKAENGVPSRPTLGGPAAGKDKTPPAPPAARWRHIASPDAVAPVARREASAPQAPVLNPSTKRAKPTLPKPF